VSRELRHPVALDPGLGRVAAETDHGRHVDQLIRQVLLTTPGERVNRPDFGCGLLQLVFAPNSDALATATQFLVQGSLQRWLADVVQVERVRIDNEDERLLVEVVYTRLDTGARREERFLAPLGGA
jgi:uncharacterized protein